MDKTETREKKTTGTAGSWCKSVSAFANGTGGTLMLSLDDTALDQQRPMAAVAEQIKREVEPLPEFDVLLQQIGGKRFLVLNIFQGKEPPYYYIGDGNRTAYCRMGNHSMPADDRLLSSLTAKNNGAKQPQSMQQLRPSYDSQITLYDFEDVSFTKLKALYRQYTGRTFQSGNFEELGLTAGEKLTNAGLLLADEAPAPAKQPRLVCARWEGEGKEPDAAAISDYKEYSGSLLILLQSGIEFVKHNSRTQRAGIDETGREYPDYPQYCVAEGLVNALAHSDYERNGNGCGHEDSGRKDFGRKGGQIRMDIYDDRMEIHSLGGQWTSGLPYRNPVIVRVFQALGCMKGRARGLEQIRQTYEKQVRYEKGHQPQLHLGKDDCTLVLYNLNKRAIKTSDKKTAKKTIANKEKVLEHLKNNGASKTSELSQMLDLSFPRTRALLSELVSEGLIKPNGNNKNRTYDLVE